MPWLWAENVTDTTARLAPEEEHHLTRVLRKRPPRTLAFLDGDGRRGVARWRGGADLELLEVTSWPRPHVQLVLALGARNSNETALRRAAELGAAAIQPVWSTRSRDAGGGKPPKRDRWQRILRDGCAQSGNPWCPQLHAPITFAQARTTLDDHLAVLTPDGAPLASAPPAADHALAIGPEGGWTPDEIAGLPAYSLGRFILRTPVAVAAVLSTMEAIRMQPPKPRAER